MFNGELHGRQLPPADWALLAYDRDLPPPIMLTYKLGDQIPSLFDGRGSLIDETVAQLRMSGGLERT